MMEAEVEVNHVMNILVGVVPKPYKPIQTHPKTSNKFGRGKRRCGNRKTTLTIEQILPAPRVVDGGGVTCHHPPKLAKLSTMRQLIRCLNMSKKKQQIAKDKMVVAKKRIVVATKNYIQSPMNA